MTTKMTIGMIMIIMILIMITMVMKKIDNGCANGSDSDEKMKMRDF